MEGKRAVQLPSPPIPDEIGQRIFNEICAACWTLWWKDLGVKVINEFRLDLSSEGGQNEYDRNMREFLGMEPEAPKLGVMSGLEYSTRPTNRQFLKVL